MNLARERELAPYLIVTIAVFALTLSLSLPSTQKLQFKIAFKQSLGLLPSPEFAPMTFRFYRLKRGDTLWDLSRIFGLNVDTLVAANALEKIHLVAEGRRIRIPVIDGILAPAKKDVTPESLAEKYSRPIESVISVPGRAAGITNAEIVYFVAGAEYTLSERMDKLGTMFLCPLPRGTYRITDVFRMRINPVTKQRAFHAGIDLGAPVGTPVHAAMGGLVVEAYYSPSYGNFVIIDHAKGFATKYAHMSRLRVTAGQRVGAQTYIGASGNTGRSTGPHLHFEVLQNGRPIDPRGLTDFR